jgi:hypothetical protein
MNRVVAVTLAVWLALALLLGDRGVFVSPPGVVPFPLVVGILTPLMVFLTAFRASADFRAFVMGGDLFIVTTMQAWRFGGFGFLALYAHDVVPGIFAWPTVIGDMAIGLTAPWIACALIRRPGFAISPIFVIWNLLGILDLVVRLSLGVLVPLLSTGEITIGPMARMPLVLLPAFMVPLFCMLHLTALFQARRAALADRSGEARPPAA